MSAQPSYMRSPIFKRYMGFPLWQINHELARNRFWLEHHPTAKTAKNVEYQNQLLLHARALKLDEIDRPVRLRYEVAMGIAQTIDDLCDMIFGEGTASIFRQTAGILRDAAETSQE